MTLLYQGKSGIVKLASTYALYGVEMPPPLRHNTPPTKFLSGRILNPISVENPSVRAEILGPSIHQFHCLHHLYHTIHGQVTIPRDQGCDT